MNNSIRLRTLLILTALVFTLACKKKEDPAPEQTISSPKLKAVDDYYVTPDFSSNGYERIYAFNNDIYDPQRVAVKVESRYDEFNNNWFAQYSPLEIDFMNSNDYSQRRFYGSFKNKYTIYNLDENGIKTDSSSANIYVSIGNAQQSRTDSLFLLMGYSHKSLFAINGDTASYAYNRKWNRYIGTASRHDLSVPDLTIEGNYFPLVYDGRVKENGVIPAYHVVYHDLKYDIVVDSIFKTQAVKLDGSPIELTIGRVFVNNTSIDYVLDPNYTKFWFE